MKIDKSVIEGAYIIKLSGEISFREKDTVKNEFTYIVEEMKRAKIKSMLIDASGIDYIDSLEIGFFVNMKKNMSKEEIEMRFINVSEEVMGVFKLLSLEKILCKK